jgi:acetylornithine deacetylase/succinyl-diaminopimelate desuccinylase-like protein
MTTTAAVRTAARATRWTPARAASWRRPRCRGSTSVAVLSGAEEIAPDVTLSDRASDVNRDAARDYLVAQLGAIGLDAELQPYAGGANVWATLDGEGTGGVLVIGAHFDTVPNSPGADDNATGVAVVLGAGR